MTPERTCVGCRQRRPDVDMVRIGLVARGRLGLGRSVPGRGAWLCPTQRCLDKAERSRSLERALRRPLGLDAPALHDQLVGLLGL